MKHWEKIIYLLVAMILIGLFLVSYLNWFSNDDSERIYNISVIINEDNDAFWKNTRKGMDHSASEFHVDINFITLYNNNSTLQQADLIKREIDNGTEAIIISPADSEALAVVLDRMVSTVPIIVVGSSVPSSKVSACISSDNKKMGEEIAREAVDSQPKDQMVYILTDTLKRYGMKERFQGVISILKEEGVSYTQINNDNEDRMKEWVENLLKSKENCTIISLEENNLIITAELIEQQNSAGKAGLYGIGNNNQIIFYLENSIIQGIQAPDYFSLGYLSIEQAIAAVKKEKIIENTTVKSIMVFPDTIYNKDSEIKLFPIT